MLKRATALALCAAVIFGLSACRSAEKSVSEGEKIKVSVTFNALYEFAKAVGGDKVEISTIVPDGMETHDFEPKAKDLADMRGAQVFVYNGLGIDAWAEDAAAAAGNDALIVVKASKGTDAIVREGAEASAEAADGGMRGHGKYDPHTWLSLKCAATAAENIKSALCEADPGNRAYYEDNCAAYQRQLDSLFTEYDEKFGGTAEKNFVTGHAAFAYLCRDFGLRQLSVRDVFADGEPSARQLAGLVDFCRDNGVTTIFAEALASPEVSETLASEAGAVVETIYTIERGEDGMSYLARMEASLSRIYASLR
ncbi:MAG: zinc ABC transporter substrate-binding protein [Oscillospiraceae bacterium]|jgi:zinc transport system substrate-binding protein|nr:zinc ABC transporter substrate-binding protein [Oscillospiraceae bacterium]